MAAPATSVRIVLQHLRSTIDEFKAVIGVKNFSRVVNKKTVLVADENASTVIFTGTFPAAGTLNTSGTDTGTDVYWNGDLLDETEYTFDRTTKTLSLTGTRKTMANDFFRIVDNVVA